MNVAKLFNFSVNSDATPLNTTNFSAADLNLTDTNVLFQDFFSEFFSPLDYLLSNNSLDIDNSTSGTVNTTKESDEGSGTWLENLVDKLNRDETGKPLLHLVMMIMSFLTEALASVHAKIKEKPLIHTPIPMLTKILHHTTCTGVYSLKSTVQAMVMAVFIQVDPWVCLAIVFGTAVGQLVCNWTHPNTQMDLHNSKRLPSDTDLNIDMDIFKSKGRHSPLGQENTVAKIPDDSPKLVKQSFMNSSAKIPFTQITLPDFDAAPSQPPPLPDTPPKNSKSEHRVGKKSKPFDSSIPSEPMSAESPLPTKTPKSEKTQPTRKSRPGVSSSPFIFKATETIPESVTSQSSQLLDSKTPIRYKKPIYGSMDSGLSMKTVPSGQNPKLLTGSNPYNKIGPSPTRSKGSDEKLLLGNRSTQRSPSSTDSRIFQQGSPVSSFIGGTRVYRAGSNPDLKARPTTHAVFANPSLYSGPSSNMRAVSNPDLRLGSLSSKRTGSTQNLHSGPSSHLRAGPSRDVSTGPKSTLPAGSNPNLRTGPNEMRRAKSNSDLQSSPSNFFRRGHNSVEEDEAINVTENRLNLAEAADPYAAVELSEAVTEQKTKPKPIPRKRSSLEDKARTRPVFENNSGVKPGPSKFWHSSVDAKQEFSNSPTNSKYNDKESLHSASSPSLATVVDERPSLSRYTGRESNANLNSSFNRRSTSRRTLPLAPDDIVKTKPTPTA